jgi:hypothetical protein
MRNHGSRLHSPAARGGLLTVVLHAAWWFAAEGSPPGQPAAPREHEAPIVWLASPPPLPLSSPRPAPKPPPAARPAPPSRLPPPGWAPQVPREPDARWAAEQAVPPPPTAEEWALAGRYTLKNSKAYRHSWGQQVRHLMGAASDGPEQGQVRFRVEIAPSGALVRLQTLWATSPSVEQRARQAIAALTRWPAPPTGQPLVFERTIVFSASATEGPPLYADDCKPEPPAFRNPFAWDGRAAPAPAAAKPAEPADPTSLEDCLRQLPRDSIDAELARDRRLLERWGWSSPPR